MNLLKTDQIQRYLERIGLAQPVECTLEGLNSLIGAQLTHIPFEALDVWGGRELSQS